MQEKFEKAFLPLVFFSLFPLHFHSIFGSHYQNLVLVAHYFDSYPVGKAMQSLQYCDLTPWRLTLFLLYILG